MPKPMMPIPDGIYETHLTVRDLEASVTFYRNVLGLVLAHRVPDRGLAFFWVGGRENGMLGLWQGGHGPLAMRLHFAFRTSLAQVLAAPDALKACGVAPLGFSGEPTDEAVVLGWMPAASVYFADPDGHSLEYIATLDATPDSEFGVGPWSRWQARNTD